MHQDLRRHLGQRWVAVGTAVVVEPVESGWGWALVRLESVHRELLIGDQVVASCVPAFQPQLWNPAGRPS